MTDPNTAQRAHEWLERQLAELAELRNATRRDHNFKSWRQHTLTVIQRIWPGDSRRVDRFRRIPFSPPMSHPTEKQVREFYERGWGEAGVLLREFLAEVDLRGVGDAAEPPAPTSDADAPPPPALGPARAARPASPRSTRGAQPLEEPRPDIIGRAMERLFNDQPLIRRSAPASRPAPPSMGLEPDSPAAELVRLAGELEALGLTQAQVTTVREALLALARAAGRDVPDWALVRAALHEAVVTPALARRALPVLLGFVDLAA